MGGYMDWPRFRNRNFLRARPNYYSDADGAPPNEGDLPQDEDPYLADRRMLSGEIDRMVYGWWLNEVFQDAIAEDVGLSREQVDAVMQRMLRWAYPKEPLRMEDWP